MEPALSSNGLCVIKFKQDETLSRHLLVFLTFRELVLGKGTEEEGPASLKTLIGLNR